MNRIQNKDGVHALVILPGWVSTDMGGQNATLTPEQSVTKMMTVIDSYKVKDLKNGGFYSKDGNVFAW